MDIKKETKIIKASIKNAIKKYGALVCDCCKHRHVTTDTHHEWLDKKKHILCPYCHAIISHIIYPSVSSIIWEEVAEREGPVRV